MNRIETLKHLIDVEDKISRKIKYCKVIGDRVKRGLYNV